MRRCGDQILEYNGSDLRFATAEQAAYELAKPAEKAAIVVQYNYESKYIGINASIIPEFFQKKIGSLKSPKIDVTRIFFRSFVFYFVTAKEAAYGVAKPVEKIL
jgi:hypothetical protein